MYMTELLKVPFGEVTVVKDWLKIKGPVYKPEIEHPKKPVLGLTCTRIEVSGCMFRYYGKTAGRVKQCVFEQDTLSAA